MYARASKLSLHQIHLFYDRQPALRQRTISRDQSSGCGRLAAAERGRVIRLFHHFVFGRSSHHETSHLDMSTGRSGIGRRHRLLGGQSPGPDRCGGPAQRKWQPAGENLRLGSERQSLSEAKPRRGRQRPRGKRLRPWAQSRRQTQTVPARQRRGSHAAGIVALRRQG